MSINTINLKIGSSFIGREFPCYLIAEIGVNHGGDMELCRRMILEAKAAGANAVKFQTFTAETLVSPHTEKVRYQIATTDPSESHFDMIKSLEFSKDDHRHIFQFCKSQDIEFISTPYDPDSVDFLEELGVSVYKTASADLVDFILHERILKTRKPVIIATGMAKLGEIEELIELYRKHEALDRVVLMHCVSNYPCSDESLNLNSMKTLSAAFGLPIGYSDHSIGSLASSLSIVLGACIVEKHFTTDKSLKGPDHKASSTPEEFKALVQDIRRTEIMLGESRKYIREEERQMAGVSRKSLFSKRKISSGEIVQLEDFKMKRPGGGFQSSRIYQLIGKTAACDIEIDTMISDNMFK